LGLKLHAVGFEAEGLSSGRHRLASIASIKVTGDLGMFGNAE
jgi:hypothetical protein